MKQKHLIIGILVVLILLTATFTVLHLSSRNSAPEGAILIQYKGKTSYVQPDQLSPVDVSGTIINGKGEEKKIQGKGVPVSKLAPGSFDLAVVTAEDEYSASVPAEDAEQAWILINEDGSYRLIVFGDGNAKRDVKNVCKVAFS